MKDKLLSLQESLKKYEQIVHHIESAISEIDKCENNRKAISRVRKNLQDFKVDSKLLRKELLEGTKVAQEIRKSILEEYKDKKAQVSPEQSIQEEPKKEEESSKEYW